MRVICAKDELLRGMQIIQPVIASKITLPVLSNFLFETDGQRIKLSATDLEIGVTCYIKGEIQKEGGITIPAKRFADIIKELPNGDVEIKADETNQINIKSQKSKFILMGIEKKEYPALPDFPNENVFLLKKEVLNSMLKKTIFAVSKDTQRYVLNGVYLITEEGSVKAVSTDGRRLAYICVEGIENKVTSKAIIPTKAVTDILRLIAANEKVEEVKIGLTDNLVSVEIGDISFQSKLIEGVFPNYEQVIPKKTISKIKLNVSNTMSAVKQMALLTGDRLSADRSSSVKFSFEKNKMIISANTVGLGSGEAEVEIDYANELFDINFNPNYIKDILQNIDDENVVFAYTTSQNPIILTPEKDNNYICVVMPMRS
ncbi:MAG: DNA polymerase III subunit beta [Endomicrobiia bacterium]|nr:DNA polymerase III subunit beta [Endomicrobiaceae bacterium]MDD3053326.1 DNA polymerase III subunit beta [Endomicrobiaceae bacterium]MDD3923140.1 DNA polymerase III subunit beta [Endomicrobiaceae bacterium]MDD5101632.1 DNA polymerase III subunit beta [Endomicrobiaceae bacterium]